MVATFIIEEHNEAFFIWNYAIRNNIIAPVDNILLHVDEHADFELPVFISPVITDTPDYQSLLDYTRENLSIDDFIIPCIYQGVFKQINWMRQKHSYTNKNRNLHLALIHQEPELPLRQPALRQNEMSYFYLFDKKFKAALFDPKHKSVNYSYITTDTDSLDFKENSSIILDLDLDYFFSDEQNAGTFKIQITEQEYMAYKNNTYHKMRFMGSRINAIKEDNAYYYTYQSRQNYLNPQFDPAEVCHNIEKFSFFLEEHNIKPDLISICRSRFSGYTPAEHWQWIEDELLNALAKHYHIRIEYFPDLLKRYSLE